ncbi:MAG: hypothetical protein AAB295_04665, partial [Chloroflexota bacterium]
GRAEKLPTLTIVTNNMMSLKDGLTKLLESDQELASLRLHIHGPNQRSIYLVGSHAALSSQRYFEWKQPLHDSNMREVGTLAIGFWQRSFFAESSEVSFLNTVIVVDLMVMFGLFLHLLLRELVTRPLENFV